MTDPRDGPRRLPLFCPFCGKQHDHHQSVHEPADPEPGDIGVCWGCRNVFVFETPNTARRPTADEQSAIDADHDVALARGVLAESYTPDEAVALTRQILNPEEP